MLVRAIEWRQRYKCKVCGKTFSETIFSEMYLKHWTGAEIMQCFLLFCFNLSPEKIAKVLKKSPNSVHICLKAIAQKSEMFHTAMCINLIVNYLQLDEMWTYIKSKKHKLWIFTAIEATSKFWFGFEIGSRTKNTANKIVSSVKKMITIPHGKIIKFTTDKLSAYKSAIETHFPNKYSYLQVVKTRFKKRLKKVEIQVIVGKLEDFREHLRHTAFVERLNLTIRHRISYLRRRTIGFCKKKEHLKWMLWINLFDYNYVKVHKSLRVKISENQPFKKSYKQFTPAMKIGITNCQLDLKYLLTCPIM